MATVYTPRFATWLRRSFGLREPFAMQLDTGVRPMVGLVDPARADHFFHRSESLWVSGASFGAVVGQFTIVGIRNPSTSGKLVIVQRISLRTGAGGQFQISWHPSPVLAAAAGVPKARDGRLGSSLPSAILRGGSNVAQQIAWIARTLTTNVTETLITTPGEEWVLPPDDNAAVCVEGLAANIAVNVTFDWVERELGDEGV